MCHTQLERRGNALACTLAMCPARPREWPIVRGVPILIDETRSFFRVSELLDGPKPPPGPSLSNALSELYRLRPKISRNVAARRNYRQMANLLGVRAASLVLVVGCGVEGEGISFLAAQPGIQLIMIDVRWTSSVQVLSDAHQLPFVDCQFEGVVIQAVLEHVSDPWRVISEITRVLKPDGLVYSEWPFLQPVHGGAHDFTRLTQVGHRQAWRSYIEIASGACGGPGMALAHVIKAFLRCLTPWRAFAQISDWLSDWTLWWLSYLDIWLANTPAGMDAASGFYFLGRKAAAPMSISDLVHTYRGAQR
jgi:SAM-dependent methyltransferase